MSLPSKKDEHAPSKPSSVLIPGEGCLEAGGVWVLSLTGHAVRCITPDPRPPRPPSPLEAAAAVDEALDELDPTLRPKWVVIGADVDPLTVDAGWHDAVLAASTRLMDRGVGIRLSTRGAPSEGPWAELLRRAAVAGGAVLEVGLFSLDPHLSELYEPGAAKPKARLGAAMDLGARGIRLEGRVHPLLPWITDMADHIETLLRAMSAAGIRKVHTTYLHLDARGHKRLGQLPAAHQALLTGCLRGAPHRAGTEWLLPRTLRIEGYRRFERIAAQAQVEASVCIEVNPDVPGASSCLGPNANGGTRSRAAVVARGGKKRHAQFVARRPSSTPRGIARPKQQLGLGLQLELLV